MKGLVGRVPTPPLAHTTLRAMDRRLRELTWGRLVTLLVWTLLVMIKHGISQLIETIEERIFVRSEPVARAGESGGELRRTLLPPLDDELVLGRIWPLLHQRVNVSLLWRLRRVNRAWREQVSTTVEWAALEMVRVDTPGFLRNLAERGERRPSLQKRVENEVEAFKLLLSEHWWSVPRRPEGGRSGTQRQEICDTSSESEGDHKGIRRRWKYNSSVSERGSTSREVDWSEGEEIEACVSSTDSSMQVYYPRHVVR